MTINSDFDGVVRKQISLGREIRGEWGGGNTNVKVSTYQRKSGLGQDDGNTFGGWWKPKTGGFIVTGPNGRIKNDDDDGGMSFSDYQGSQNYKATTRTLNGSQNWSTQEYFFGRGNINFANISVWQAATTFVISNATGYARYNSSESGKPYGYGRMESGFAVPERTWARDWHQLINDKQYDFIDSSKYDNSFNVSIRELAADLIKDPSQEGLRYPPTYVRFFLLPVSQSLANELQLHPWGRSFTFIQDEFNYKAFGTGVSGYNNWNLGNTRTSNTYTRDPGIKVYTTNAIDFRKWRLVGPGDPANRVVGASFAVRGVHYAQPKSFFSRGQNANGGNISVQLNLVAGMTTKTSTLINGTTARSLFSSQQLARGDVINVNPPIRMQWWPNARRFNNNTGAWAIDRDNTANTFRGFEQWDQNGQFGNYIDLKNELRQGRSRIIAFHTGDLWWESTMSDNWTHAYVNQIHIPPVQLVVTT